jgi:hypothetical protein
MRQMCGIVFSESQKGPEKVSCELSLRHQHVGRFVPLTQLLRLLHGVFDYVSFSGFGDVLLGNRI